MQLIRIAALAAAIACSALSMQALSKSKGKAKAKAVAEAAKQRRDDDDDKQYREPAHAGALIVVRGAFSFLQNYSNGYFSRGNLVECPVLPF